MKLYLYQNQDDHKKVNKKINIDAPVYIIKNVLWKEDTSILHPTITFHKSAIEGGKNLPDFNYVGLQWDGYDDNDYITNTRYFFVGKPIARKGGMIELECEEDYRFTWRKWIVGLFVLIARQEHVKDLTLPDERKKIPLARKIDSFTLTGGTGGVVGDTNDGHGTIVLTVSG